MFSREGYQGPDCKGDSMRSSRIHSSSGGTRVAASNEFECTKKLAPRRRPPPPRRAGSTSQVRWCQPGLAVLRRCVRNSSSMRRRSSWSGCPREPTPSPSECRRALAGPRVEWTKAAARATRASSSDRRGRERIPRRRHGDVVLGALEPLGLRVGWSPPPARGRRETGTGSNPRNRCCRGFSRSATKRHPSISSGATNRGCRLLAPQGLSRARPSPEPDAVDEGAGSSTVGPSSFELEQDSGARWGPTLQNRRRAISQAPLRSRSIRVEDREPAGVRPASEVIGADPGGDVLLLGLPSGKKPTPRFPSEA